MRYNITYMHIFFMTFLYYCATKCTDNTILSFNLILFIKVFIILKKTYLKFLTILFWDMPFSKVTVVVAAAASTSWWITTWKSQQDGNKILMADGQTIPEDSSSWIQRLRTSRDTWISKVCGKSIGSWKFAAHNRGKKWSASYHPTRFRLHSNSNHHSLNQQLLMFSRSYQNMEADCFRWTQELRQQHRSLILTATMVCNCSCSLAFTRLILLDEKLADDNKLHNVIPTGTRSRQLFCDCNLQHNSAL